MYRKYFSYIRELKNQGPLIFYLVDSHQHTAVLSPYSDFHLSYTASYEVKMAVSKVYTRPFEPVLEFKLHDPPIPEDHPVYQQLYNALVCSRGHWVFEDHQVYLRRNLWAVEAPLGTFTGFFAPGAATHASEREAMHAMLQRVKEAQGANRRFPFWPSQQIIIKNDRIYLKEPALRSFYKQAAEDATPQEGMLCVLFYYLQRLTAGTVPVFPTKKKPFIPLTDRPVIDGHRRRGPTWTAQEDDVIRRFFSRQADGTRVVLTDEHWQMVLETNLKGRRTKAMVLSRINYLNHELKKTLLVEGYLPRENVKEWQDRRYGQHDRVPNHRERLHGSYRAGTTVK